MKTVGEKFEAWLEKTPESLRTMQQAFAAGHVVGAEHRHDEVYRLREALESLWAAIGDMLCGKSPLDIKYAQHVAKQIQEALL